MVLWQLVLAREMLYELLTNCIPPDMILKALTRELLKHLDDTLKHEIIHWAAFYEHRVQVRDPMRRATAL